MDTRVNKHAPQNEAAALEQIAKSWQSNPLRIRRFLSRYECNDADVQDIIQDAFVEALRCLGKFQGMSSLETWMFGIMLNVARHHVGNASSRNRQTCSLDDLLERTPDAASYTQQSCDRTDPSRYLQSAQLAQRLSHHVASMPASLQQTFELLFVRESSYVEAAQELGVPVGTIRSRAHRVRELLKPLSM
ncbi:sigma-70 family RNA polymerase sigma factor [Xenophilus aerolatus]